MAAAAFGQACSLIDIKGDTVPFVEYEGTTYLASPATDSAIAGDDMTPIGNASSISSTLDVADSIMYSLEGVDERVLVMRAGPSYPHPLVMLIAEGTLQGTGEGELFEILPGLCTYFPEQQAGC